MKKKFQIQVSHFPITFPSRFLNGTFTSCPSYVFQLISVESQCLKALKSMNMSPFSLTSPYASFRIISSVPPFSRSDFAMTSPISINVSLLAAFARLLADADGSVLYPLSLPICSRKALYGGIVTPLGCKASSDCSLRYRFPLNKTPCSLLCNQKRTPLPCSLSSFSLPELEVFLMLT